MAIRLTKEEMRRRHGVVYLMRCLCVGLVLLCGLIIQFVFNLKSALHLASLMIIIASLLIQFFSVLEARYFHVKIPAQRENESASVLVVIVALLGVFMLLMGIGAVFLVADTKWLAFGHEGLVVVASMLLVPSAVLIATLAIISSDEEEYIAGRYYGVLDTEPALWAHVAFNFLTLAMGISGFVYFAILVGMSDAFFFSVLYILSLTSFVLIDEYLRRNAKMSFFWSKVQ